MVSNVNVIVSVVSLDLIVCDSGVVVFVSVVAVDIVDIVVVGVCCHGCHGDVESRGQTSIWRQQIDAISRRMKTISRRMKTIPRRMKSFAL